MAPHWLQASAVSPLVEIVRQRPSRLSVPPGEATPGRAARGAFPFGLGRQSLPRPSSEGVRVIPVYVGHWMVLEGAGYGAPLPVCQLLHPWAFRNSVSGCLDEFQVPSVGHLIDVHVEGIEVDKTF